MINPILDKVIWGSAGVEKFSHGGEITGLTKKIIADYILEYTYPAHKKENSFTQYYTVDTSKTFPIGGRSEDGYQLKFLKSGNVSGTVITVLELLKVIHDGELKFEQSKGYFVKIKAVKKEGFTQGGEVESENNFRYVTLKKYKNKLVVELTDEGREEVKELKEDGKGDYDIMPELFEDVQGNSEYVYHHDLGASGLGMTDVEGVTFRVNVDEDGSYPITEDEGAKVYFFNDSAIRSPLEDLLKGEWVLTDADSFEFGGGIGESKEELEKRIKELKTKLEGFPALIAILEEKLKKAKKGGDKSSTPTAHAERLKKEMDAMIDGTKSDEEHKKSGKEIVTIERLNKLIAAGYVDKEIKNIYFGYNGVNKVTTDGEYQNSDGEVWMGGMFNYHPEYIEEEVENYVKAAKHSEYELGLKYPELNWSDIAKKYGINTKSEELVTVDENTEQHYAVYKGKNVSIGYASMRITLKDANDKPKREAREENKETNLLKASGGYWGIVSNDKEIINDIVLIITKQPKGYMKDMNIYINGLGGLGWDDLKKGNFIK